MYEKALADSTCFEPESFRGAPSATERKMITCSLCRNSFRSVGLCALSRSSPAFILFIGRLQLLKMWSFSEDAVLSFLLWIVALNFLLNDLCFIDDEWKRRRACRLGVVGGVRESVELNAKGNCWCLQNYSFF